MISRHFLLLALLPLAAGPALAGARDDVMSGASRCVGISDDRSWLDCYYGAAQPMRAQLGLVPAPAAQLAKVPSASTTARVAPSARAAVSTSAPHRSGFMDGLFGTTPGLTTIASYRFDRQGFFTVTLGNGQTWQQISGDTNLAHWREAGSKYRVSVEERFGQPRLTVDNDGQTYIVRRVN
jgi:hypothetical protein